MLKQAVDLIARALDQVPEWAIVLGSGLGVMAESLKDKKEWSFSELPGMDAATAPGHTGKVSAGYLGVRYVLIFSGRNHAYEGYSWESITRSMSLVDALGIRKVLLTSAVGAVHGAYTLGDLVLIKDHVNLIPERSRQACWNSADKVYDPELAGVIKDCALAFNIPLKEGVLSVMTGPAYETRAEYRMLRRMGADLVGMSLVPEALAARMLGMQVVGLSVVSDVFEEAVIRAPVTAEEVLAEVQRAAKKVLQLLTAFINN